MLDKVAFIRLVSQSNAAGETSLEGSPQELVIQARDGDRAAFAELIRLHERTALAVAYGSLGDASAAGDVTQEAFLRAWQRLGELEEPARFAAWLTRIVRNLSADQRRRRSLQQFESVEMLGAIEPCRADPTADLDQAEMRQRIDEALQTLDETTRSAVVLRYYEGLPSKRIGELLNLSPAAVDMRLSRARAELRDKLAWADPTSLEA
jgi:RNA polymerase sigma-70 factor, ECF subfamily